MANNDRGGVRANTVSKKQKKTSMKTKGIASELAGTSFHLQLCAENVRHEREREWQSYSLLTYTAMSKTESRVKWNICAKNDWSMTLYGENVCWIRAAVCVWERGVQNISQNKWTY